MGRIFNETEHEGLGQDGTRNKRELYAVQKSVTFFNVLEYEEPMSGAQESSPCVETAGTSRVPSRQIQTYLCNEFALMNMEICPANTACFDFDLLRRSLDIGTDVQEKD